MRESEAVRHFIDKIETDALHIGRLYSVKDIIKDHEAYVVMVRLYERLVNDEVMADFAREVKSKGLSDAVIPY